MSPIAIGSIVFACVFGGALVGMFLRKVLPEHHLDDATKDVVKLVTGLIATLAALVLGLLIASAKGSFEEANTGFRQSAAKVIMLDRTLAQYGADTAPLRQALKVNFAGRVEQLFHRDPAKREQLGSEKGTAAMESMQQQIRSLVPQTDAQRSMQAKALGIVDDLAQARWMGVEAEENAIPGAFLTVLVFWLATMFASFGLFAPRNAMATTVLFLGAVSLAAAIFLIEEMNDPFDGVISISSAPMYRALGFLGK